MILFMSCQVAACPFHARLGESVLTMLEEAKGAPKQLFEAARQEESQSHPCWNFGDTVTGGGWLLILHHEWCDHCVEVLHIALLRYSNVFSSVPLRCSACTCRCASSYVHQLHPSLVTSHTCATSSSYGEDALQTYHGHDACKVLFS